VRPIRLFTIVFGDQFMHWFEHGLLLSLSWPKNRAALEKVVAWDIWTTSADEQRVMAIAGRLGVPVVVHSEIPETRPKESLFAALIGQMKLCKESRSAFFFASPDSVFGDGTVPSLFEVGIPEGICVAVTPMRVASEGFLEAMGTAPVSNAGLVRLGFERMHEAFRMGDASLPNTNSYASGLSWRRIGDGLYAVSFRMPSAYLMQPTGGDVKWMLDRPKFGNYDHQFPKILVEQQRQRVIGSSDAAFVVELTPAAVGNAPLVETNPNEPDRYIRDYAHHIVNRNTVAIWRAQPKGVLQ
jgi:hypothetical protein